MKLSLQNPTHAVILARDLHDGTRESVLAGHGCFVEWERLDEGQRHGLVLQARWLISKYRILA